MSTEEPRTKFRAAGILARRADARSGLAARRRERGFTLIELMIAVIVLAILAASAFPSFRTLIVGQRIRSASFDAMSAFTLARSEAIKRNAQVDLAPIGGSWLNGWTIATGSTVLMRQSPMGSGLSITCYSGSAASTCQPLSYVATGRLLPGSAMPSILITSTETSSALMRCISVDPSGRPRSAKGGCL